MAIFLGEPPKPVARVRPLQTWVLEIQERINWLGMNACSATAFDVAFGLHKTLREIERLAARAADDAIDRAEYINRKE